MVPFHGEARVVAPVREFEEAHGGFMDGGSIDSFRPRGRIDPFNLAR